MAREDGGYGGQSLEDQIVEAAIIAHMEHEGWKHTGGGQFHREQPGTPRFDYYARKGSVRIEANPNVDGSDMAEHEGAISSDLDAAVFDYWPGAIDALFRKWREELPSWGLFAVAAGSAEDAASEISTGVATDKDGSEFDAGNPRLASDLSNLEKRTAQLNGAYSSTFSDSYVTPLAPVMQRQHALAAVLAIALEAEKEVWLRTSNDLLEIQTRALAAMKASGPESGGDMGLKAFLTVIGAPAAGVSAIATGGLAAAAVLGSAGAGTAVDLLEEEAAEDKAVPLGASHPHRVRDNIEHALEDLNDAIRGQEERIEEILTKTQGVTSVKGLFDLPEPDITTAPPEEVLSKEQIVIVNPEMIGRITSLWIPSIVGDLRHALSVLPFESTGAWHRPAGIGLGSTGPKAAYEALEDTVVGLLKNTATELDDAGTALLDAARIIGLADEEVNQTYRRQARRIAELNDNSPG